MEATLLLIISVLLGFVVWFIKESKSETKDGLREVKEYVKRNNSNIISLQNEFRDLRTESGVKIAELKSSVEVNKKLLEINELQVAKLNDAVNSQKGKVEDSLKKYGQIIEIIEKHKKR